MVKESIMNDKIVRTIHNNLSSIGSNVDQLQDLSRSLYDVGQEKLAQKIDEIANKINESNIEIQNNLSDLVYQDFQASQERLDNLLQMTRDVIKNHKNYRGSNV